MSSILARIWDDEEGFIVTMELILVSTIVVIGSIVGLTCLRDALNSEMSDLAECIDSIEWCDEDDEAGAGGGDDDGGCPGNGNCGGPADAGGVAQLQTCLSFNVPPSNER